LTQTHQGRGAHVRAAREAKEDERDLTFEIFDTADLPARIRDAYVLAVGDARDF
jgi:hypothetical protein